MINSIYLCWVDDIQGFPKSFDGHFKVLKNDFDVDFDIDEHTSTKDFDIIARNILDDLVCMIDYNLKEGANNNIDGHEVIGLIRRNNSKCKIVFYSSKATQEELRELVKEYDGVICTTREDLRHILTDIARNCKDGNS